METKRAPTRSDLDFHRIKPIYQKRSIEKGLSTGLVSERDVELIKEFIAESQSCNNINKGRVNKLVSTLISWRRFIGPYEENTIGDLYSGVAALKEGISNRGTPYKQNTRSDFVIILRQFYAWMIENGYSNIPLNKFQKLKVPPRDKMTKVAADLLKPDEVKAMVRACTRSIDRAIIITLYEGGFRIGELGKMTWGDLKFDQYGVVVNVNFKTEKPRYIRLIMAREHLAKWKTDYPFEPEGDALVFISTKKTPLTHAAVTKQMRRIAERAGIEKYIKPHIFRHSRITHLIKEGVSESVIKLMMWGNIKTDMFETYAHLTGKDIDNEMLKSYGIKVGEQDVASEKLEPRQCQRCQTINSPTSNFCTTCGASLTEEAAEDVGGSTREARMSPEYMEILKQLRKDLGIKI
jgi:integrase/recombinase XerD